MLSCGATGAASRMVTMHKVVLLRHGESVWNMENRFTGWTDVDLTQRGVEEAKRAGETLKEAGLAESELPLTECLKDTVARFLPYWSATIAPEVLGGRKVIIAAHGNSLRALVKSLDGVSDAEIVGVNIPTGIPLVYELDSGLRPLRLYYLGDPAEVEARTQAVADQAKARN